MALTIKVDIDKDRQRVTARERLFRTADDKRLVPQSDPDAAFLFCTPGSLIPREDAIRFGLIKPVEEKVRTLATKVLTPETK